MIAAHRFVREATDDFFDLDADLAKFEREKAFTGCELVHETHRLALMNAMLHDIDGEIILGDTLSNLGKGMKGYDLVLTNPLKKEDFQNFEAAYKAPDRRAVKDERWSVFTREEIEARGTSLDLGLIRDESVVDYEDLPDPVERGKEDMEKLEEALDLMQGVVKRLQGLRKSEIVFDMRE